MTSSDLTGPKWAKLISLHPDKPDIHLPDGQESCLVSNEWKIYQKSSEESNTCWIQNLSRASTIDIEDSVLLPNEEKEISNGEKVSFSNDSNENFNYIFCLYNAPSSPKNPLKRTREESLDLSNILKKIKNSEKQVKPSPSMENDLHQELTCSICMGILHQMATLSPCQHTFCSSCLFGHLKCSSNIQCPLCRIEARSVGKNLILNNLLQILQKNFQSLQKSNENSCFPELIGEIIKNEKGVYIGPFLDHKREGQGRMIYTDGRVYEGAWKNNKREGKGVITFANGNIYEGSWVDNVYNGHGKLTWATKNRAYEGNWLDGKKDGFGEMKYSSGSSYKGDWKNDKREGKGVLIYPDSSEYDGDWVNDLKDGYGVIKCSDGSVYKGEWKNGKREGKGTLTNQEGDVYEGSWANDSFNGMGKYKWSEGAEYEGNFENDFLSGYGEMKYADGMIYKGEWKESQREGKGTLILKNGDEYEGEWVNNRQHGKGKYMWKEEKRVFEGTWEFGEMSGEGMMSDLEGNKLGKKVRRSGRIVKQKKQN